MSSTQTTLIGVVYTIYSFLYFVAAVLISSRHGLFRFDQIVHSVFGDKKKKLFNLNKAAAIIATLPLVLHIVALSVGLSIPPKAADYLGVSVDSYPNLTGDLKTIIMMFDLVQLAWAVVMLYRLNSESKTPSLQEQRSLRSLTIIAIYIGSIGAIFCGRKQIEPWIWGVQLFFLSGSLLIVTVLGSAPHSLNVSEGTLLPAKAAAYSVVPLQRGPSAEFRVFQNCPDTQN